VLNFVKTLLKVQFKNNLVSARKICATGISIEMTNYDNLGLI
jgi:hypothetical protein